MSGLFGTLGSSVKALNAHGRAIETAGKNLANVNNPSYARQRVIYGDRGTVETPQGAQSLGLEVLGIQQVRDSFVDRQLLSEVSLRASIEAEQKGYQRAQAGLGQSIDRTNGTAGTNGATDKGLASAIDDFFSAFQSFAARPTDSGERQTLLQKANILTDRFQLADARLDQVQADLDAQVETDVADANRLLGTIAELNSQIARFESGQPGSAVDLRDQRQARLEELATKMSFETREATGGQIQVFTRDTGGSEVLLVDLGTVREELDFNGTDIVGLNGGATLALTAGSIKGAMTANSGAVQSLRDDLDALARQFVTAVNDVYNPTNATGNFFAAAGTTAATISLDGALTAANLKASDGGAAGDNTIALAVAALASQQFSTGGGDYIEGSFSGFFSDVVSEVGQALAGANARLEDQSNIEQLVRSQRDGISGVSLDEEMADLLKFQRAYQASSRVFQVVDELLEVVVTSLGR